MEAVKMTTKILVYWLVVLLVASDLLRVEVQGRTIRDRRQAEEGAEHRGGEGRQHQRQKGENGHRQGEDGHRQGEDGHRQGEDGHRQGEHRPRRHHNKGGVRGGGGGGDASGGGGAVGAGGITVRDFTGGQASEDFLAPATTRVLVRLTELTPRTDGGGETVREGTAARRGQSTPEGSGAATTALPTPRNPLANGTSNVTSPNTTPSPPLVRSNCSQTCMIREELKRLRVETFKSQILSKLRLKEAPNITGLVLPDNPRIQRIRDAYEMQSHAPYSPNGFFEDENESHRYDDYHARTMTVLNFANPIFPDNTTTTTNRLRFNFDPLVLDHMVKRAELYVYVRGVEPQPLIPRGLRTLQVYQLYPEKRKHNGRLMTKDPKPIASCKGKVPVGSSRGTWFHCNITRLTHNWIKRPPRNAGIMVDIKDFEDNQIAVVSPSNNREIAVRPYLEVSVEEKKSGRRKREMQGLQCKENDNQKNCCMYPLVVDFEEFKWDWIIAPKNYLANFCSGECPFVFLQQFPHTHLVQQSNPLGSTGPCCTATKLSAISMLYFDNRQNVVLGKLPGMTVDRCGCS